MSALTLLLYQRPVETVAVTAPPPPHREDLYELLSNSHVARLPSKTYQTSLTSLQWLTREWAVVCRSVRYKSGATIDEEYIVRRVDPTTIEKHVVDKVERTV